jgi:hypothetical protein
VQPLQTTPLFGMKNFYVDLFLWGGYQYEGCSASNCIGDENTVIFHLTSDPANEDLFRRFSDSANEYGFG